MKIALGHQGKLTFRTTKTLHPLANPTDHVEFLVNDGNNVNVINHVCKAFENPDLGLSACYKGLLQGH